MQRNFILRYASPFKYGPTDSSYRNSANSNVLLKVYKVWHITSRLSKYQSICLSMGTNQTDQSSSSGMTRNEQIFIAHVVLSIIPCLITIPLGIFIARFCRKIIPSVWFHLHWTLQVIFSTIPVIVGFVIVHHFMEKSHFNWADTPHSVVGHILTFVMAFELIFGVVYTCFSKCHVRKLRIVHNYTGNLILILALVETAIGIALWEIPQIWLYLFFVWLALLILIFFISYFKTRANERVEKQ
ncbi:4525_t:CDS:2, partial [Dentiscutata heterogama]